MILFSMFSTWQKLEPCVKKRCTAVSPQENENITHSISGGLGDSGWFELIREYLKRTTIHRKLMTNPYQDKSLLIPLDFSREILIFSRKV